MLPVSKNVVENKMSFFMKVNGCQDNANLKKETGETLRGNRQNTEGNRTNIRRNMRKRQGKR